MNVSIVLNLRSSILAISFAVRPCARCFSTLRSVGDNSAFSGVMLLPPFKSRGPPHKRGACLPYPYSLVRPTKALEENTDAREHTPAYGCRGASLQDMSLFNRNWSFHQNEQSAVYAYSSSSRRAVAPCGSAAAFAGWRYYIINM